MFDDDERLKNFVLFKFYGTDKELEEASPALAVVIIIALIGLGVLAYLK